MRNPFQYFSFNARRRDRFVMLLAPSIGRTGAERMWIEISLTEDDEREINDALLTAAAERVLGTNEPATVGPFMVHVVRAWGQTEADSKAIKASTRKRVLVAIGIGLALVALACAAVIGLHLRRNAAAQKPAATSTDAAPSSATPSTPAVPATAPNDPLAGARQTGCEIARDLLKTTVEENEKLKAAAGEKDQKIATLERDLAEARKRPPRHRPPRPAARATTSSTSARRSSAASLAGRRCAARRSDALSSNNQRLPRRPDSVGTPPLQYPLQV